MPGKSKDIMPLIIVVAMGLSIALDFCLSPATDYPLWKIRSATFLALTPVGLFFAIRARKWLLLSAMLLLALFEGSLFDHVDKRVVKKAMHCREVSRQSAAGWRWDRLYRSVAAASEGENIVVSPCGVASALALIGIGAGGDTARAFGSVFSMAEEECKDTDRLHKCIKWFFVFQSAVLRDASCVYSRVEMKNSMWLDLKLKTHRSFVDAMRAFDVEVHSVDMAGDATSAINSHVRQATKGRIDRILESAPPRNTCLIAVNSVSFHGEWQVPFNKAETFNGAFRAPGGDKSVSFMHASRPAELCEHEGVVALRLPYRGDGLEMVFVLPPEGQPIAAVEARLDAAFLNMLISKSRMADLVTISLPKFGFSESVDLKDAVKSTALCVAFTGDADFSGIADESLVISEVLQNACIRVDEDGTEAAAATSVVMQCASVTENAFIADRPFLFVLREKRHGLVLFAGRVVSP